MGMTGSLVLAPVSSPIYIAAETLNLELNSESNDTLTEKHLDYSGFSNLLSETSRLFLDEITISEKEQIFSIHFPNIDTFEIEITEDLLVDSYVSEETGKLIYIIKTSFVEENNLPISVRITSDSEVLVLDIAPFFSNEAAVEEKIKVDSLVVNPRVENNDMIEDEPAVEQNIEEVEFEKEKVEYVEVEEGLVEEEKEEQERLVEEKKEEIEEVEEIIEEKKEEKEKVVEEIEIIKPQKKLVQMRSVVPEIKYDTISKTTKVDYYGRINNNNTGIYTLPKTLEGAKLVTSYVYNNYDVRITEEVTTENAVFSKLTLAKNGQTVGWINKDDLTLYSGITAQKSVDLYGLVKPNNEGIYTTPRGTYQSLLYTKYLYNNKYYRVVEEAHTSAGVFYLLKTADLSKEIGWINKNDLSLHGSKVIENYGTIKPGNKGIYTQPKLIVGSKLITSYLYNGKNVKISEIMTINGVEFGKAVHPETNAFLGWIEIKDINFYTNIHWIESINLFGTVKNNNTGIYTLPKGSYKGVLVTNYVYNGKSLKITEKASTQAGIFYKLVDYNDKLIGWIHANDVSETNFISDSRKLTLISKVKPKNAGIYTNPKGSHNSVLVTSYVYNNKNVQVVEEVSTLNGVFYKINNLDTGTPIGWINKNDVSIVSDSSTAKLVNYSGKVLQNNKGIYTLPQGTPGAKLVTSYVYNNKRFNVIEEMITSTGAYAKLAHTDSKQVVGWINKDDLEIRNVVFLDIGHGGSDPGAQYYGISEKDLNFKVGKLVQQKLESEGYFVILSRTNDTFVDHSTERSALANKSGADIFVSIHHNAMPGNSTVSGIETFYYEYDPNYQPKINKDMHNDSNRLLKSAQLANAIHSMLITDTGSFDRGVKRETFAVLRETALPAVLLELGFMSNRNELDKLTSGNYQNTLASSVVKGINSFFKMQ